MDMMTFFVGVIAFCMTLLTVGILVFLFFLSKSVKALDEKVTLVSYELAQILPNIRRTTQNIADISGVMNIFSLFKRK